MKFPKYALLLVPVFALCGCQVLPVSIPETATENPSAAPVGELTTSPVAFFVQLPAEMANGQELVIEFLDEITGLAITPERVPMQQMDATHYIVTKELPLRAVIKYRYYRKGSNPSQEYNSLGQPVRYRFVFNAAISEVHDIIAGWSETQEFPATGMIEGRILNIDTSEPAGGILLACGGDQVISSADGTFWFEKLLPGQHTLSALSMEGTFFPFQQQAIVAVNSRTQADFSLHPAPISDVQFILENNGDSEESIPIRIIGDLAQSGNTFSNQGADQSVLAGLAPVLEAQPDGTYQVSLQLPAGQVFTYKYSLGDGLWNSERQENGGLLSRKVLISEGSQTIHDTVFAFGAAVNSSITFNLEVPANTSNEDQISIQFNPFAWSPPLPMQKTGEKNYQFILYGPQDLLGDVAYRYCRAGKCGNTSFSSNGRQAILEGTFASSPTPQIIYDVIPAWPDWQPSSDPTIVFSTEPVGHTSPFVGGFHFSPIFSPFQKIYAQNGWDAVTRAGANTTFLSPTWEVISAEPFIARQLPGLDMNMTDIHDQAATARKRNLQTGLFPQVMMAPQEFLSGQPLDLADVIPDQWAEMIGRFYHHFAAVAQAERMQYLVVDGSYLDWRDESAVVELLINIRQQFKGKVLAAASPEELKAYPPEILRQFDGLYTLLSCPLPQAGSGQAGDLPARLAYTLDKILYPAASSLNLPVLLEANFPAVNETGSICYQTSNEWSQVKAGLQPVETQPADMPAQTEIYNQVLSAAATRDWISGVISGGYILDAARTDASPSVHGKPAADVLWYWFNNLEK